ncbi:unnamed protein product [Adineta steineri]|uniref:Uncharacterized protein n=1 Tax=Adineta steineri TaxID=433720 RepID=A0A813R6B8_9BILA|nr:unnamed protein product [Adineta steineri]CAF0734725.1 unnamed protein product [Adineta steineri]CAF0739429.1 unnamed protein product [Adineta steineri]CAF0777124.1 unnamed protein product [Adineta steineri]CAF3509712.1 unnamed protein product [Adineta steineri]
MPRSYSRSQSRSRSNSPNISSYRRSRSPARNSNDQEDDEGNNCRIHVADLSSNCTKRQIEKAFEKWPIVEVWHAQASCFAFVVLRNHEDVQQAINGLDGRFIGDARVRVTLARPRIRASGGGSGRRYFDPNKRCYQCGGRGHFSRDCGSEQRNKKRSGNGYRSRSRERERRRERSYSKSRSRSPRPRVIREYRRYSPRRSPPSRSNYKSRDNGSGYYSSPPRT